MNNFYDMTYEPGIDESKIDRLTLHLSLCSFRGTRTYDAGLKLCCICDVVEKHDVNSRGELWIIEAFHFEYSHDPSHSRLENRRVSNWSRHHRLYATFLLLATYCLSCICSPSKECRTQSTVIRQFRQDCREGLLVSALTSDHFSGLT